MSDASRKLHLYSSDSFTVTAKLLLQSYILRPCELNMGCSIKPIIEWVLVPNKWHETYSNRNRIQRFRLYFPWIDVIELLLNERGLNRMAFSSENRLCRTEVKVSMKEREEMMIYSLQLASCQNSNRCFIREFDAFIYWVLISARSTSTVFAAAVNVHDERLCWHWLDIQTTHASVHAHRSIVRL